MNESMMADHGVRGAFRGSEVGVSLERLRAKGLLSEMAQREPCGPVGPESEITLRPRQLQALVPARFLKYFPQ